MEQNLITDLSATTAVTPKLLNKLSNVAMLCICDYLNDLDMSSEDILNVDIGIGTISFLVVDNTIQYTFQPSKELEENIIDTMENKMSPLTDKIEQNLEKRILATYKELI